jgi:hypothetical protein
VVALRETIDAIREKIRTHRDLYNSSEESVRFQIVNPILKGLGWDPENPNEVLPNISIEGGVPDYTLLKEGKKVLFIEAKKLSADVEQNIPQLAKYCFNVGMNYGVLTNGATWVLFRAFKTGIPVVERIVLRVDIENDDPTAINRKLGTISKENVENIENLIEKHKILDKIWQSLFDEPKEMIKGLVPIFEKLIREDYPDYTIEPSEIEDFMNERINELVLPKPTPAPIENPPHLPVPPNHPKIIRINGDSYEIRFSYEILIKTAEWLIGKGELKKSDCPISGGYKRYLINLEPKHKPGDNFRSPKQLSNETYIETSYSTTGCINMAQRLLEKFGHQGDILEIG